MISCRKQLALCCLQVRFDFGSATPTATPTALQQQQQQQQQQLAPPQEQPSSHPAEVPAAQGPTPPQEPPTPAPQEPTEHIRIRLSFRPMSMAREQEPPQPQPQAAAQPAHFVFRITKRVQTVFNTVFPSGAQRGKLFARCFSVAEWECKPRCRMQRTCRPTDSVLPVYRRVWHGGRRHELNG